MSVIDLPGRTRPEQRGAPDRGRRPPGTGPASGTAGRAGSGRPASARAGPVRCFVALGDSITAGLGDGVSMGRDRRGDGALLHGRGWAARMAGSLGPPGTVRFANLATTGATATEVRRHQVPAAAALRPEVASLIAGMNDLLRPSFDPLRLRHDLVWSVGALRACGAVVLMARLHDPGRVLRLPGPVRRRLTRRVGVLNAAVDAASGSDPGVGVVDLADHPEVYRLTTFDVDRVHPGPRGHQLLARAFAERLCALGVPIAEPPADAPDGPCPSSFDHAVWLASVGAPWLFGRVTTPLRAHLPRPDPPRPR
jgi:lysophospholipase L1-like esterase